jgi:DNA-binding response OmpR family regulator
MAIKVVAVDDEASVLQLITVKLKKAGFEVVSARDGDEAVARAREEKPDVVVLDVMMPRLDGFAVAACIKAEVDPPPLVGHAANGWEWKEHWRILWSREGGRTWRRRRRSRYGR